MPGPKSENAIARTISLPDDIWALVDEQSAKWRMNRSATIRRMIYEWGLDSTPAPQTKKADTVLLAA